MVRLDRTYVFNYIKERQAQKIFYYPMKKVRGDGIRSNHHPLSFVLKMVKFFFKVFFLEDKHKTF